MTNTPQTGTPLTPSQLSIAQALAAGASISSAAKSQEIGRTTIYDWIKSNPDFSTALDDARQSHVETLRDRIQDLSRKALDTLEAILDDPKASAAVRLRASLAVLNRKDWALPGKIGTPAGEHLKEALALAEASYRQSQLAQQAIQSVLETPLPNTSEHNIEETQTPYVRPTPKVGRNEPCPCNSGKKYKRCCLRTPPPNTSEHKIEEFSNHATTI